MFVEDINLALNKSTWQISENAEGIASRAVDGNLNANYGGGSCTHTTFGHVKPWLTVDLEHRYLIQKVTITNRGDCCGMSFCIIYDELILKYYEIIICEMRGHG